jgi:ABC transporter ATM
MPPAPVPCCCSSLYCRAFLKAPGILLFDEATSALDTKTEKGVLDALSQLAAGRTSIFVAHRLSTAAQCDQIVVLEDGRVAEAGSPAELLEAGGKWAQLWERQASVDDLYDAGGTDAEGGSGSDAEGGPQQQRAAGVQPAGAPAAA